MNKEPDLKETSVKSTEPKTLEQINKRLFLIIVTLLLFLIFLLIIHFCFFTFGLVFNNLAFQNAKSVILHLGVSASIICLILWVSHVINVIKLSAGVGALIWGVFISSLLATTAYVYKDIFSPNTAHNRIKIEKLILADERAVEFREFKPNGEMESPILKQLNFRSNVEYAIIKNDKGNNDILLCFFVVVSGYQKNELGASQVTGQVFFKGDKSDLTDVGALREIRSEQDWQNLPVNLNLGVTAIESKLGSVKDKIVFPQILRRFDNNVLVGNKATLRVLIKDLLNNTYDETTIELNLTNSNNITSNTKITSNTQN
jgi:hypothetical protein